MTDSELETVLTFVGYIPMPSKVGMYAFYWQRNEKSVRKLKDAPMPYRVEFKSFNTALEVAEYLTL